MDQWTFWVIIAGKVSYLHLLEPRRNDKLQLGQRYHFKMGVGWVTGLVWCQYGLSGSVHYKIIKYRINQSTKYFIKTYNPIKVISYCVSHIQKKLWNSKTIHTNTSTPSYHGSMV